MADTNHGHGTLPVEGDGVSYKGIVWFIVILVGTVVFCQLFVVGLFKLTASRVAGSDVARAPLAAAPAEPRIEGGRLVTGLDPAPTPSLLVTEPTVLKAFRAEQDHALAQYGWINEGAQIVRLPISRAKDLALERGFPVRPAATAAAPAASGQ